MNKIFRIVWNEAAQAWVAVSELTKTHKKRASATVATAVLATVLSAAVQATGNDSGVLGVPANPKEGYVEPRKDDIIGPNDEKLKGLGFGLAVVGKDGHRKPIKTEKNEEGTEVPVNIDDENTSEDDIKSTVITVEPNLTVQSHQRVQPATFT